MKRRRIVIALGVIAVLASVAIVVQVSRSASRMRAWSGEGVVLGKREDPGEPVVLQLDHDRELPVLGISSRIDVGDRVVKRAGDLAYEVNGTSVHPLPPVIGSLLFFWLFLPLLVVIPSLIFVKTREA